MSFSNEWDNAFAAGTHMSIWPWSDLVSYVSRYAGPKEQFRRVLELGCGMGANIPFFMQRGCDYHAVEGSSTAVKHLKMVYPHLADSIICADFTVDIPFGGQFDLVVDRGSTPHNPTAAVQQTLRIVFDKLRPAGKFIGIDWFSDAHEGARKGFAVDDYTRRDIEFGSLKDLGFVHFFSRHHLLDLLSEAGFFVERLEHKVSVVSFPADDEPLAWWHFSAVKK